MSHLFSKDARRRPLGAGGSGARPIPPAAHAYPFKTGSGNGDFLDDTKLLKKFRNASGPHGSYPPQQGGTWKKDKVVNLLDSEDTVDLLDEDGLGPAAIEEYEPEQPTATGRITIYCTAQAYNIKALQEHLEGLGFRCRSYPEVLLSQYVRRSGEPTGEIFFFEYGVVVFWDLSVQQETSILRDTIKQFEEGALSSSRVEADTFQFRYQPYSKPYIQNDVITIAPNLKDASLLKMSISFALSQSVKLSVLEDRVLRMAALTKQLPTMLAREGKVKISDTDIAKLMGRVFLEQSQLNLLGSVLDTPEVFWDLPDAMQSIYDRVWDYLEMDDRVETVNARLGVLHEMLEMLRQQQVSLHGDFLEWIIIWLIVIDVIILLFQLAATLGIVGPGGFPRPH